MAEIGGGYRVELLTAQDAFGPADVIELWQGEGALPRHLEGEAERRLAEVLLVASHPEDGLVGVSTAYLRHNDQLRMDLWHYRGFIARAHRQSAIGLAFALVGRDHLSARFAAGADPRGAGMIFEVEHRGLRQGLPDAVWPRSDFTYIGVNAKGRPVRVHYFPGALAPPPPP